MCVEPLPLHACGPAHNTRISYQCATRTCVRCAGAFQPHAAACTGRQLSKAADTLQAARKRAQFSKLAYRGLQVPLCCECPAMLHAASNPHCLPQHHTDSRKRSYRLAHELLVLLRQLCGSAAPLRAHWVCACTQKRLSALAVNLGHALLQHRWCSTQHCRCFHIDQQSMCTCHVSSSCVTACKDCTQGATRKRRTEMGSGRPTWTRVVLLPAQRSQGVSKGGMVRRLRRRCCDVARGCALLHNIERHDA